MAAPEPVSFMTIENGDDLIVSFAVDLDTPGEVVSVILMRTPKFESFLEEQKRGVHVSHELYPESDDEFLRRFTLRDGLAEVESTQRTYLLDVSRVDPAELKFAGRVMKRMNFDQSFRLELP